MKAVKVFLTCVLFILLLSQGAYALEDDTTLSDTYSQSIYDSLASETKELLDDMGVEDFSFSSLSDISVSRVFKLIFNIFTGKMHSPLKNLVKCFAIILLLSIGESFMFDGDSMGRMLKTVAALFIGTVIIIPVSAAVADASSAIILACDFMRLLIPILAAVISFAGNPMLAVSAQSLCFGAAQFITHACKNYIIPVTSMFLSIDIASSLIPEFKLSELTTLLKRIIIGALSFTVTIFVAILGLKGVLANSADSLASKGIKLLISGVVPIVGGAISEAYNGIIGSLTVAKSAAGVAGIAVIAVTVIPTIIELVCWNLSVKISAAAADLFGQSMAASMLKSISSVLTLVTAVLILVATLFIISIGLILMLKAG